MDAFNDYVRGEFEPDKDFDGLPAVAEIHRDLAMPLHTFRTFAYALDTEFKKKGFRGVELESGYSIDNRPNARAAIHKDKDIIVVNLGLAILIRNVFSRSLHSGIIDKMFFSGIYDAHSSGETIDLMPNVTAILSGSLEVEELTDESDKILLSLFTNFSLLYVFHHELAHIWNGHVGLNASTGGGNFMIDESGTSEPIEIDPEQHALEMDADIRAIHALLVSMFGLSGKKGPEIPLEVSTKEGFYERLLFLVYSLQVTLSILHLVIAPDGGIDSKRMHPSARLRRQWMLKYITDTIRRSQYVDQQRFDHILYVTAMGASASISAAFTNLDLFSAAKVVSNVADINDFLRYIKPIVIFTCD